MELNTSVSRTSLNQPIHPLVAIEYSNKYQPQGLLLAPKLAMAALLRNLAIQPLLQLPQAAGQHKHLFTRHPLFNKSLSEYR